MKKQMKDTGAKIGIIALLASQLAMVGYVLFSAFDSRNFWRFKPEIMVAILVLQFLLVILIKQWKLKSKVAILRDVLVQISFATLYLTILGYSDSTIYNPTWVSVFCVIVASILNRFFNKRDEISLWIYAGFIAAFIFTYIIVSITPGATDFYIPGLLVYVLAVAIPLLVKRVIVDKLIKR